MRLLDKTIYAWVSGDALDLARRNIPHPLEKEAARRDRAGWAFSLLGA
ncbi:hypothetical protein [Bradyrhizobium nanningense]|nr:hypothetical protein [Bradyrhizobium nanningense]